MWLNYYNILLPRILLGQIYKHQKLSLVNLFKSGIVERVVKTSLQGHKAVVGG